jgi:cyclic pyranopterin phosphate synthase
VLTHIDDKNQPTMVDVSDKEISVRMAEAQSLVQLPPEVREHLKGEDLVLKKGPVFQTAIIAGTMAVKKTSDSIPFCHQIPIESCKTTITMDDNLLVTIRCRVKTTGKTGVEMEALHGASVAALTVYDMCKAISHDIEIKSTKLFAKTGGKRTMLGRPTYGLVLTGGKSQRMGEPKALIDYTGKPHAVHIHDILTKFCDQVFLSAREDQWKGSALESYPTITDEGNGPINGMLAAFDAHPEVNWIVVACDLVHFNSRTVETLLANATEQAATAFRNSDKGFPEALCAFYTPQARVLFKEAATNKISCPIRVLKNAPVTLIDQGEGIDLANVNTNEERAMHAR